MKTFGATSASSERVLRVLVLGQVPPPYGGQSVMTEILVNAHYANAEILHVNAKFSSTLAESGELSVRKVLRLVPVLMRSIGIILRYRPEVLYYHPAGRTMSAILRDIVLLLALRPMFQTVVFHMHARGLPATCETLPKPLRALARRVYACPNVLVGPSRAIVEEAAALSPHRMLVIPNGTPSGTPRSHYDVDGPVKILFLNLVSAAKGASWLLDALATLAERQIDAQVTYVGEVSTLAFGTELRERVVGLGLAERVAFIGPAIGTEKWDQLAAADILCVPTTWDQESFGLVLVEAASCGLPIVSADVPGVREVLERDVSVLLADPHNPASLATHLESLCSSAQRRAELGRAARARYLDRYTTEHYRGQIDEVFAAIRGTEHVDS